MKTSKLTCILALTIFSTALYAAEQTQYIEYTASKGKQRSVEYMDPTKPIVINARTPVFNIKLDSNPTTGYKWFYDADKSNDDLQTPLKQVFLAPENKNLVGAPGAEVWTFRVNKEAFTVPTVFKITLIYARAWEITKPGKTLELTIITTQD